MNQSTSIVIIPARMSSIRLPGKPLADIAGIPMIVQVLKRALEADVGQVIVATDTQKVANVVREYGGKAIMTRLNHLSGSDRIWEALQRLDPQSRFETIINVQGDLPTIAPEVIRSSILPLDNKHVALATLATQIISDQDRNNPNVVKLVGSPVSHKQLRALYFTRVTAPWGEGPLYHHIGLYAWRRTALHRFISLPPSSLELREKLEQLRALEDGMRVDASIVDIPFFGVDTQEDLEKARQLLS
ncbi:3-deoxy-manno-octulosonate cytidylyltransferase [Candidatus Endowatersipora endosymbiont of Watersipora subatra]|uniref:3-deoxy-manno-octulosonate cytidylyltransferase n=1 Tax=Candidatus Endowatersipora endosymbiont of Watersipora subatra TaxID=3077946 RepID=UPI00312C8D74